MRSQGSWRLWHVWISAWGQLHYSCDTNGLCQFPFAPLFLQLLLECLGRQWRWSMHLGLGHSCGRHRRVPGSSLSLCLSFCACPHFCHFAFQVNFKTKSSIENFFCFLPSSANKRLAVVKDSETKWSLGSKTDRTPYDAKSACHGRGARRQTHQ